MLPSLSAAGRREFIRVVDTALRQVRTHLKGKDKKKGVVVHLYALVDPKYDCYANMMRLAEHGSTDPANPNEYKRNVVYAAEKALRLARHLQVDPHLVSAYNAGRDRAEGRKAGAICLWSILPIVPVTEAAHRIIMSAAGIDELTDEALLVATAKALTWQCNWGQLQKVVELSNNKLGQRILDA